MLKKFSLAVSSVAALFWVACSSNDVAGGTIDPNTFAENSSSSTEDPDVVISSSSQIAVSSSSSRNAETISSSSACDNNDDLSGSCSSVQDSDPDILPESSSSNDSNDSKNIRNSSSSTEVDVLHQLVTDASIQCMALNEDPSLDPTRDDVDYPLPEAFRYVGTERTGFTIKWLELTAGVVAESFDVYVSGDTLYVSAKFDYSNAQRHKCLSQIDFGVDNAPAYTQATLLHFQNGADSWSSGVMRIFDLDVIQVEDPE